MKTSCTLSSQLSLNSMRGAPRPLVAALNDCEKPLADLFIVFGVSKSALRSGNNPPSFK